MLLCARYILPVSHPHIENGAILVRNDRIADIGYATDLKMRYPMEEVRDFGLSALMPGFVDVHTHLEYTTLRGMSPDVPYAAWKKSLDDKSRGFSPQDWDDSALLGGLEAVASGITTAQALTASSSSDSSVTCTSARSICSAEVSSALPERAS